MTKPRVEDYLDLSYRVRVVGERAPDGAVVYVASHPELPGCMAQGATPDEALAELREARRLYIAGLLARDLPVPHPDPAATLHVTRRTFTARWRTSEGRFVLNTEDEEPTGQYALPSPPLALVPS